MSLRLNRPITFLVGENGSGKSTLLGALAWALGFPEQGGDVSRSYAEGADGHALGRALKLGWRQRVTDGYFLRAESFFNWVRNMEHGIAGRQLPRLRRSIATQPVAWRGLSGAVR